MRIKLPLGLWKHMMVLLPLKDGMIPTILAEPAICVEFRHVGSAIFNKAAVPIQLSVDSPLVDDG